MTPAGWTGPFPVLYHSFDTLEGLTFNEGHGNNASALVTGMVNSLINVTDAKLNIIIFTWLNDPVIHIKNI